MLCFKTETNFNFNNYMKQYGLIYQKFLSCFMSQDWVDNVSTHTSDADDTQFFTKMSVPMTAAIGLLQDCVEALQYWFWNNGLLLNPSTSAIVYFGTHGVLKESILPWQIIAAGCTVNVSDRLCMLGVMLDNTLSFDQHVNNIVKNYNYHLQALRLLMR